MSDTYCPNCKFEYCWCKPVKSDAGDEGLEVKDGLINTSLSLSLKQEETIDKLRADLEGANAEIDRLKRQLSEEIDLSGKDIKRIKVYKEKLATCVSSLEKLKIVAIVNGNEEHSKIVVEALSKIKEK